jgi:hypothetical protein
MDVEGMELASHADHAEAHARVRSADDGGRVSQVFAPVDANAGVPQGVVELEIKGLAWRRQVVKRAEPPEEL